MTSKIELAAIVAGMTGTAAVAACAPCVHAMNIRLISVVKGKPISMPPILEPKRSETQSMAAI